MKRAMSFEEASVTLNRSLRTVQRWAASGKLETENRDGKALVLVEVPEGEALAQLQRQADDTGKVAALAAVTGERAALAYQGRAEELERRVIEERTSARGWRWVAVASIVVAVVSAVALSWTMAEARATRDTLADTRKALDASATARERLEGAFIAMTLRDTVADSVACADE